ncbi:MAG: Gfo/Idh/MocA family oxidoreductase [Verrucomicrobiales bacterium]|nr:Gfo/Idh/MocA family oxidoreductase [Verrucomicrobiales bacterium]
MKPKCTIPARKQEQTHHHNLSRRRAIKFLAKAGAAGVAGFSIVPKHVLGGEAAPSNTVVMAAIGTGSRGPADIGGLAGFSDVRFAAVCDVDLARAQQSARRLSLEEKDVYQDYRPLLERKDIDAVVIASPDHWHALHSIDAALSGKDVYVEKCMTLTVAEGRAMVKAIRQNKRVLQVGSQQRSQASFHRACMLVRNGYIGKVTKVIGVNFAGAWECNLPGQPVPSTLDWDQWMGQVQPKPFNENIRTSRSRPGWLSIKDFCGGEICGWGAHDLDQVQWALGMDESGPTEVWVEGQPYQPWVADENSQYGRFFGAKETIIHMKYPGDIPLELSEDANPNGGALFIGEKGQIRIDRGRFEVSEPGWKTLPLERLPVQLYTARNHYRNYVDGIKERKRCVCDVEIGHRSATVCHLGNIARWVSQVTGTVGTRLKWDPVKEQFTNSALANSMLERPRRKGFELPKV